MTKAFQKAAIPMLLTLLTISVSPDVLAQGVRNGLPPTSLDSFVTHAGGNAETIYGDEGVNGPPPMFGFTSASRIGAGITGQRDAGLTTGHGSYMPSAWGADEFIAPPGEFCQSGSNGGNPNYNGAAANLDAAAQAQAAQAAAQATSSGGGSSSTTTSNGGVIFSGGLCTSGTNGASPIAGYPPAPSAGCFSVVGCGGDFQGWMSVKDYSAYCNGTENWGQALYNFYTSSAFQGDPMEAAYEISQIQASGQLGGGM